MTMVKNSVIDQRYLTQFSELSDRLSPENLHCDGEISNTEAQRKYVKLMKAWKRLEKKVGRTVTEEEIFNLTYPNYYQKLNQLNL